MKYSTFLEIIYTIVGLAFMAIIGFFYYQHLQGEQKLKTHKKHKENIGEAAT